MKSSEGKTPFGNFDHLKFFKRVDHILRGRYGTNSPPCADMDGIWQRLRDPRNSLRYALELIFESFEHLRISCQPFRMDRFRCSTLSKRWANISLRKRVSCAQRVTFWTTAIESVLISNDRCWISFSCLGTVFPRQDQSPVWYKQLVISFLFRGFTAIAFDAARVLVTFYCGKLDDTETIMPALKGLATLASLATCTSSDVEDIIRA